MLPSCFVLEGVGVCRRRAFKNREYPTLLPDAVSILKTQGPGGRARARGVEAEG
jgi:hypothetical protein